MIFYDRIVHQSVIFHYLTLYGEYALPQFVNTLHKQCMIHVHRCFQTFLFIKIQFDDFIIHLIRFE